MKKYLLPILSLISLLTVVNFGFTQRYTSPFDIPEVPENFFGCLPTDSFSVCAMRIGQSILRFLLTISLIFAAVMLIWGGLEYMFAGQDETKRKKIKDRIIYASVGLIVAFLSWALVSFISARISNLGVEEEF